MKMQMSIVNKEERKAAEKYFQRTKVDRQEIKILLPFACLALPALRVALVVIVVARYFYRIHLRNG